MGENSKLSSALPTALVQLRHCIKIHTSKAFVILSALECPEGERKK
jgi:hypothetical protein